ncbi:RHS repeat-associated core domain-containing protein [Streptomyces sp. NPDC059781]|uniref:RHS repeat-associated core domain-containing protein n=1 Tax=Streptomyces sp. NPDC059781 TaxID=3346943 RepID=UPI00365B3D7D
MAADARSMREEAARDAKSKIDEASDAGIQNRSWWEEVGDWFVDNWDTIVAVCKIVVAVVGIVAMIIGGPILGAIVLIAALVVLVDTLYRYSKGQASLWDVGLAALDCIPGMKGLTTLGGLAKGMRSLGSMGLKGMALSVRGLAKSARGMANGAKGAYNRLSKVVRSKGSDPVDMATGAMYLPQSDIELPGLLALVFTRRVASDYRCGWWFGPTWASTVDQRLEVDADGIVYVTEDGLLLAYRHPTAPQAPELPVAGPRWPLIRLEDGSYRIHDPMTGHTRHFARPDGRGNALITGISDHNQHTITFDYDEHGTPLAMRHSGGYHLALSTEGGRITALSLVGAADDGSDVVVKRYGYTDGNLTETFNSSGLPLCFTYDHRLRVTSWTDRNGSTYTYTYDDRDRCVAEGGEAGHVTITLDYDGIDPAWPDCRITTLTTTEGAVTRFVVNDNHQIIAEIDPLSVVTRTEYDEHHHVLAETDALGHRTAFELDQQGCLTRAVRFDGREFRVEYNELCLPETISSYDGGVHHFAYDERGNRTAVTVPEGSTFSFRFDEAGRLTSLSDPQGRTTGVRCDPAGLPLYVTDSFGAVTHYERDAFGCVTSVIGATGTGTRLQWTVEGRLLLRTGTDGSVDSWAYDGEGNCISHTDAMGGVTRFEYTHFDLLAARTGPDGARYEFDHDAQLRLIKVTDPQGLKWTYEYDAAGRLVAETDFDGLTVTYRHDAAGRVVSRANAIGQSVLFERDALGRVVKKRVEGRNTTFAYDAAGRLVRAESPEASLDLRRDIHGRVLAETVNGRTVSSTYDALGRRTARTTPSGTRTARCYDEAGRLASMVVSGRPIEFTYDEAGRELTRRSCGSATVLHAYDSSGRPESQSLIDPRGTHLQHRTYTYRADGNVVGTADRLTGDRRLELDGAGRVTVVHAATWTERYAYDEAGNQTEAEWPESHPGQEAAGTRDYEGTRMTRAGRVRYEYDALGRVTLRRRTRLSRKPDVWRYTWDAEDRLTESVAPDGTRWRYGYDPLGRRTAKLRLAEDGETVVERTDFTWDGATLCEQRTVAPGIPHPVTVTWEHNGVRPVAQTERITVDDSSQEEIDSRFFAIVTDLVGTPTELVDEEGGLVWRTRSTLWGVTAWTTDSATYTPLRFPGQYFDPETGLHYNYFRHYDPETGRYVTPDPLGLEPAPNSRTYVRNPYAETDPLGLAPYPNEHLAEIPIHSRYDRFYVRAGELVENRVASHPLTEAQMYGGEVAGHGGVRNLSNEDLTRFGGPQGNDPISGYREWGPGDSPRFPGTQVHITGGHHRTAEVVRRIGTGEMDPEMLIEFALRM